MQIRENNSYLNPYMAGFLIGLTLLASFLILGTGLGASSGLARIAAWCGLGISPEHILKSAYFGSWGDKPLEFYLVFMLAGIFIGGFSSALTNGRIKVQAERGASFPAGKRLLLALIGGIFVGFASRLARGCTTGLGLSGSALLTTGGFVFILAVFAGGFVAAWFFGRQWHD